MRGRDLLPTPLSARTWNTWHFAALWVGMSVCIPTYMLAAALIQAGLTWPIALAAILIGNVVALVPMLLNGHAGTRTAYRSLSSCVLLSARAAHTFRHSSAVPWPVAGSGSRRGSVARPFTR
jgi:hypothetical protein